MVLTRGQLDVPPTSVAILPPWLETQPPRTFVSDWTLVMI